MNKHIKRCKGTENQNRQHNLLLIPQINSDTNQDQNDFLDFHADLVNMFVSANISLSQIDTQVFQNMFLHMGIDKCNIPNSENLRQLIINFSEIKHIENLKIFENKAVSLVVDGTTSWNRSFYQFSIYHPGILRHFALIQIDVPTTKNIKIIIEQICQELREKLALPLVECI